MRADDSAIADLNMIDDARLPSDGHMFANLGTSGDTRLRRDYRMLPDIYIVGDLHEIIDLGAAANHGLAQSRTIDGCVCANLNIIFDHDNADLWNLDPTFAAAGIAETVAANDHTRVKYHPIADAASMSNHHVGMKYAIGTDLDIVTDKDTRIKRRIAANFGARADIRMRENRNSLVDDRRCIDAGLSTASLR